MVNVFHACITKAPRSEISSQEVMRSVSELAQAQMKALSHEAGRVKCGSPAGKR